MTPVDDDKDRPIGCDSAFISRPRQESGGTIVAEAVITPESPWFSGHFPAEPILPGVAQLALVLEAVRSVRGRRLQVAGLRRVRFRQVVKPNDRLRIAVTPPAGDKGEYGFRVSVKNAVVCSGNLDMV